MVKGNSAKRRGNTSKSLKQTVRSILDAQRELKYINITTSFTANVNGDMVDLTQNIVQGDSSFTRDGSQINLSKIMIRFEALLAPTASTDFVRLIVFKDTQNNGVAPTITEVLVNPDPNSNLSENVHVMRRFKVLLDKTWGLNIGGSARTIHYNHDINTKGVKISYLGTTDAAASNGKNSMWALIISDEATAPSSIVFDAGMLYHDS